MRKVFFLLVGSCMFLNATAQQLIPATEPVSKLLIEKIHVQDSVFKVLKKERKELGDKFSKMADFEKAKKELGNLRKKASNIFFYGLSTLSSSEDLQNAYTASGRIAVKVMPIRKLSLTLGLNAINIDPKKGVDRDSIDLKALMFPETGNFGILFNASFLVAASEPLETEVDDENTSVVYHSFSVEPTFSYRNNLVNLKGNDSVPDEVISFENVNWTMGLRYTYFKRIDKDNQFSFSLIPYFSYFNVTQEGVKNFYKVLDDSVFTEANKKGVIYGFGTKAEVQYNSFILFADVRYNSGGENFSDNNPLKGTIVNVGFAAALAFVKK